MKLKIKKNDIVQVIAGNDKGSTGRVLEVFPERMRVLVEGVNIRKKHVKPNPNNQQGGIQEVEIPIHYSNVMILDSDKNPTRIGTKVEEVAGRRQVTRIAKKNGKEL
jgi:large subunit ribosomal protein L24